MGWGGGALKAAVDIPRRGETRGRKIISTSVGRGKGGGDGAQKWLFLSDMWHLSLVRRRGGERYRRFVYFSLGIGRKRGGGEAKRKIYESREGGKGREGKRKGGGRSGRQKHFSILG